MLAYMHNKTIRLDEVGIAQGFSVFKIFIPYDAVVEARKETRSLRGTSAVALVVSGRNSPRRVTIPLAAFDGAELHQALSAAAIVAPEAGRLADALSWVSADSC